MTLARLYMAWEPHSGSHFCFGKLPTLPPFLVSISAKFVLFQISYLAIHFYILHSLHWLFEHFDSIVHAFNSSKYMDIFEEYATSQAGFRLVECEADYLCGGGGGIVVCVTAYVADYRCWVDGRLCDICVIGLGPDHRVFDSCQSDRSVRQNYRCWGIAVCVTGRCGQAIWVECG